MSETPRINVSAVELDELVVRWRESSQRQIQAIQRLLDKKHEMARKMDAEIRWLETRGLDEDTNRRIKSMRDILTEFAG